MLAAHRPAHRSARGGGVRYLLPSLIDSAVKFDALGNY
jgi:hypothetical protein